MIGNRRKKSIFLSTLRQQISFEAKIIFAMAKDCLFDVSTVKYSDLRKFYFHTNSKFPAMLADIAFIVTFLLKLLINENYIRENR